MPPIDPRASKKEADHSWNCQMLQPVHPLFIDQQIFPQPSILSALGYSAPPPSTQSYIQSGIPFTQNLNLHLPVPQPQYYPQIVNPNLLSVNPPTPNLIDPGTTFSASEFTPNAGSSDPKHQVRVHDPRTKLRCWDHGCNGRKYSTFSNLIRHQREKSGRTAKAECPGCGAVFARKSNVNAHVAQGRCKGGRCEKRDLIH